MTSQQKTKLIIPLILIAGLAVYLATADSNDNNTDSAYADEVSWITYSYGGGMDMYQEGDRYGYTLAIFKNGNFRIYERIYREVDDERSIEENKYAEGTLDADQMDELSELVDKDNFFDFAERLPEGSPRDLQLREPAETISITLYDDETDREHRVRAYMGADRQHYPEKFYEMHRTLRKLLQDKRES